MSPTVPSDQAPTLPSQPSTAGAKYPPGARQAVVRSTSTTRQSGVCECGCGQRTSVVKGTPNRFVLGHHGRKPLPTAADLRARTIEADGCWVWQGGKRNGYGRVLIHGQARQAHRVMYELVHGPVDPKLHIDHLCRNRACINPEHLEAVTETVNIRRGLAAKLTLEQAQEIRASSSSADALAQEYGVHPQTISKIRRHLLWRTWRHLAHHLRPEHPPPPRPKPRTAPRGRQATHGSWPHAEQAGANFQPRSTQWHPPHAPAASPKAHAATGPTKQPGPTTSSPAYATPSSSPPEHTSPAPNPVSRSATASSSSRSHAMRRRRFRFLVTLQPHGPAAQIAPPTSKNFRGDGFLA